MTVGVGVVFSQVTDNVQDELFTHDVFWWASRIGMNLFPSGRVIYDKSLVTKNRI